MKKPNDNQILSEEKRLGMKKRLEVLFEEMLKIMEFDPAHPQLKDTPRRMAKMYIDELFIGCYEEAPKITVFPNEHSKRNPSPVFLGPVALKSMCSHHFLPFTGAVYVSYVPGKDIVGISKLSRIVKWFMRRPQIQEDLTLQICEYLTKVLQSEGVIVHCEASHMCMTIRGVNEPLGSTMSTTESTGCFSTDGIYRQEFFKTIERVKNGIK